jgi:hypothetical protein
MKQSSRAEKGAVTQAQISEHLDLAIPNVSKFLSKKEIKKPYDLDQIRKAYIRELREKAGGRYTEGDLDPMQERARKDKAMADKYERENLIAEGKLHDGEEVTQYIANANHRAKTRLLRLPRAIALAVPKECSIEAEQESKRLVYEALEELANKTL